MVLRCAGSLRRKLGAEWIRNMRGVGYYVAEPA